jgi:hypothetical protein
MLILVGVEVFAVAIAAGWAIGGMFELGDEIAYALMGLFSIGAAYILLSLWRRSTTVEPFRT